MIAATALLAAWPALAFKIDPWSYRPFGVSPRGIESQLESLLYNPRMLLLGPIAMGARVPAAMGQLKEAVHENLTELSIRCARAPLARGAFKAGSFSADDLILQCAGRSGDLQSHAADLGEANEEIIRAVRFNDAPPVKTARALMALVTPSALVCGEVRVPENAGCWALLMAHAAGLAANDPGSRELGPGGNVLFRSHFGDMQYLHAMASRGETLAQGHARIMLWAKFAYQVASGEIDTVTRIGSLPEFAGILSGFETVTVSEFFDIRANLTPERVRRLALGALLHTVQDSFAEGHSGRELIDGQRFGPITALRDYTCQASDKHDAADRAAHYAWFAAPVHGEKSPVTLGAQLIDLMARNVKWDALIRLAAPGTGTGAGTEGGSAGSTNDGTEGSTARGTPAQFMREAVFPMVSANAGLVAGAGTGFLRVREILTATRGDAGTSNLVETAAGAAAAHDCKE